MNVHIHFSFNSLNTRSKYPIPRHGIQIQTQLLFTNGSLSEMTDRKPCRLRSDRHIQPGPLSATCLDWHLICSEDATSSTPNFALANCRDMQSSLKKILPDLWTIFCCLVSYHQVTRKLCYGTTAKNQRCQHKPHIVKRSLVIAIPPVKYVLPGDQLAMVATATSSNFWLAKS